MTVGAWLLTLVALAAAPAGPARAAARAERPAGTSVQGRVRSAGERAPVAGARVFASARRGPAWTREATTAADGSFVLADLPSLDLVLTIVAAGHERFEQPAPASYWRRRTTPVIYLQPAGSSTYRTIVNQERNPKPATYSARLSPEELATLPGSQGDPLRALQNMPGMARVPGGLGLIVMRGATPNQSQVFFGEHPIPRAFHVPGLASVVPAGALSGIQYVPGNFDSSYGNAVGGIVTLTPRTGRRDGIHGHGRFDITAAGALVEGPMGRGSFLISANRGYLDLVARALGEEILGRNYIRPNYYDYQVIFERPLGAGATLTTRIIGAKDELRYPYQRYVRNEVLDDQFVLKSEFHRFDVAYRKRRAGWDVLVAPAVRIDRGGNVAGDLYLRRTDVVGLFRGELGLRPSRRLRVVFGVDTQLDRHATRRKYEPSEAWMGDGDDTTTRGFLSNSGLYVSAQIDAGPVTITPGVRASLFTGEKSAAFSVDPRLFVRWAIHDRVALNLGAGLYSMPSVVRVSRTSGLISEVGGAVQISQIPTLVLPGAVAYLDPKIDFDAQGPVGASQAAHLSANLHAALTETIGLDATVFYRRVRDGRQPTVETWNGHVYAQADTGSSTYGVELMLRKELSRRVYGWIAYTFMKSTGGVLDDRRFSERWPADFDQRHNLVALISVKLPRRWQIGARFRVVTGLPYTPIVGAIKTDGAYQFVVPVVGEYNSERMPTFHQLDLRVDRTWVLRRSVVSTYLDVQNIYNRQNPEGVLYNYDFSSTTTVVGVPILPVLGVRVSY
jgi:hypothetical protein